MMDQELHDPETNGMSAANDGRPSQPEQANSGAGLDNNCLVDATVATESNAYGSNAVELGCEAQPPTSEPAALSQEMTDMNLVVADEAQPTEQGTTDEDVPETDGEEVHSEPNCPAALTDTEGPTPPKAETTRDQREGNPISAARLAANRANCLQSTGPKTERGKSFSRRNSTTHGLLAAAELLEAEDRGRLVHLHDGLVAYWHPVGGMEEVLVGQIASCVWRLERGSRCELGAVLTETAARMPKTGISEQERELAKMQLAVPFGETLDRYLRYSNAAQRQLLSNIRALLQLQQAREERETTE